MPKKLAGQKKIKIQLKTTYFGSELALVNYMNCSIFRKHNWYHHEAIFQVQCGFPKRCYQIPLHKATAFFKLYHSIGKSEQVNMFLYIIDRMIFIRFVLEDCINLQSLTSYLRQTRFFM